MMVRFFTSITEFVLCSSITIWYAAATGRTRADCSPSSALLRRLLAALPTLQDLFASRTVEWARKIVADRSHPGHKLFESLPSRKFSRNEIPYKVNVQTQMVVLDAGRRILSVVKQLQFGKKYLNFCRSFATRASSLRFA